jgi:hypothetical protein
MSESEILEQAIQHILSEGEGMAHGNWSANNNPFAVFYAMLPATVEQLEIAAATYREGGQVACEHCWASLNLAKDVLGIERDDA